MTQQQITARCNLATYFCGMYEWLLKSKTTEKRVVDGNIWIYYHDIHQATITDVEIKMIKEAGYARLYREIQKHLNS